MRYSTSGYLQASQLRKNPVLATSAHEDVSSRYQFISTENMLETFAAHGWHEATSHAMRVRKESRQGYQKHMVRLRNPEFQSIDGLTGDNLTQPELIVINSHDRGSSMRILWGMIRFACTNGLIVGDGIAEVKIAHTGNMAQRLPDGINTIMQSFPVVQEQAQRLANTTLSAAAVERLIKTVYDARLEDVKGLQRVDYRLPIQRYADRGNDAFTVFNRVQEMAIRGGIRYLANRDVKDRNGIVVGQSLERGKTRAVTAISETVRYNQLAYNTVLEMVA